MIYTKGFPSAGVVETFDDNTVTVWLRGNDDLVTLPRTKNLPNWFFREDIPFRFRFKKKGEKHANKEWFQIEIEDDIHWTEDELYFALQTICETRSPETLKMISRYVSGIGGHLDTLDNPYIPYHHTKVMYNNAIVEFSIKLSDRPIVNRGYRGVFNDPSLAVGFRDIETEKMFWDGRYMLQYKADRNLIVRLIKPNSEKMWGESTISKDAQIIIAAIQGTNCFPSNLVTIGQNDH